jgi:cytochrome c
MSDLTFNKIAGAVLATGLAIVGLREVSAAVFAHHPLEKPGYAIDVPEEAAGGGAAAEAPIDWGTVLPVADLAAGEAAFAKCRSCHTINQGGANGTGPNLYGVMGQKPGVHAGFAYSPALVAYGNEAGTWQFENMSEFLKAPQKHVPGTKMTFVGLKRTDERINMIAYLNAQGSNLPPPPPNPAAAPAEGAAPEGAPTAVDEAAPAAPEPAPAA